MNLHLLNPNLLNIFPLLPVKFHGQIDNQTVYTHVKLEGKLFKVFYKVELLKNPSTYTTKRNIFYFLAIRKEGVIRQIKPRLPYRQIY